MFSATLFLHEILSSDDKDPPRFNSRIKSLLMDEKRFTRTAEEVTLMLNYVIN